MLHRPLILTICLLAAAVMLLHGAAAMACSTGAPGSGPGMEVMEETVAACPACADPDSRTADAGSCSVMCSSAVACVDTSTAAQDDERRYAINGLSDQAWCSNTVDPPPPRSTPRV